MAEREGVESQSSQATKKRKPNWTADECLFLSKCVEEHKSILRAKFGTGVTTLKKREIWRKITDAINASSSTKRTVEEVEKKWHNIQMKGKAELADARRSVKQTGGGPAGKPLTPLAEAVGSVIGTNNISISGIPGTVDTTYLMLDRPKISTETTASTIESDGLVTQYLHVISTSESGDRQQQINFVTVPQPKACPTNVCTHTVIDPHLQKQKLELEIENLTLRNKFIRLQIERIEGVDTSSEL
ncbi:myb-related transcription factor, partner of profilin-like [Ostrea edulis]|uniref:myb-related transcription factor, partner of profilin-like n=1 Tax=Ostrea edulis TaxID=37623 RepID=UPI0024AF86D5|nr:myb-related transcription factor, partner of profilin-like [Ostrea edulis]